jgi:GGDEF domain-containing protein
MIEPVSLDNIFNVYSLADHKDGLHNRLLGRVVATPSRFHVLSDYEGALGDLHGPATPRRRRNFESLRSGSHSRVVSLADIHAGRHPELIPEMKMEAPAEAPEGPHESWFRVERQDLEKPLFVNFRDGKAHMHGQPLSTVEAQGLLDDAKSGRARIRHHRPEEQVAKAEAGFEDLVKLEPNLQNALDAIGAAVKAGHVDPAHEQALHRAIFYDPMVPGARNKSSFQEEINQPRAPGGVHVMLDGNDFGSINKVHGHAAGDAAIRAMGGAVRGALDEAVGPEHKDLWRFGGDEFAAWLPSHEHANRFLRTLRGKLEAIPAVGGTHNLSMSAGVGNTHQEADQALNTHAKAAKKLAGYLPGQARMHVHSLVPGHEGEIPLDPEVPKAPPPAPVPPQSSAPKG